MDTAVLWRAAAVQGAAVVVLALAFATALPEGFFEDWGWLAGPLTWLVCATLTARVLGLPLVAVLAGAAVAGAVSVVAVALGVHWLGVALAIGVFAAWCARLRRTPSREGGGRR